MTSPIANLSLEQWAKTLPASLMVYPDSFFDRLKYLVWSLYTPLHPFIRDILLAFGMNSQSDNYPQGRQPYVLGTIAPGQTIQDFVSYLLTKGFGNHFISWKDKGQVVSLRYVNSFKYQYHLRIFDDGEVRGHYEYTPECHPVLHMKMEGVPFEQRREDFLGFMGDRLVVSG